MATLVTSIFPKLSENVQIATLICLTIISIFAMFLGNSTVATIVIVSLAPMPAGILINFWYGLNQLVTRFDLMAVASNASLQSENP